MERTDAQQLRDAQVASRSLLNGPRVFNRRGFSGAPPNIAAEEASALMRNQAAAEGGAQASRSNGEIEVLRQKGALNQTMMQQAGENQRSLAKTILQQQTANRTERHLQEQEEIARQRLTLDSVRAANAGLPAGYRRTSDGKSLEAIPGGPADSAVKDGKLNDVQAKALQFGARMRQAGETLDTLASNGISQPSFAKRAADAVGLGVVANWTQSPQQQQVEQSQRDFVNAVLRRESGAAISNAEFDNARQQYFPQMGDSPQVIEQKRRNRDLATRGILAEVPNQEARLQQLQGNEPLQRTLVRSGTFNGRRVTQFSDGSISYAD
ncbi:hypothetical protein [Ottowia thiooxydans]|uniref:hypothetical protein n=1 Tax=Ottowia thiooxydans TaxID=219182 RepID=UPI0012EC7820|nr:hypothetical protein [Ottowia thiooxydans]